MSRAWLRVAGLSGAAAVGLGAAGAHAIKPKAQAYQEVFKTASTYHLAHTAPIRGEYDGNARSSWLAMAFRCASMLTML